MNHSSRIAIWTLVVATAVCGILAALTRSELFAIIASVCATFALVAGFSEPTTQVGPVASAVQLGYGPTTSATVDILDVRRPVVFETAETVEPSAPAPAAFRSVYEAAFPQVERRAAVHPPPPFAPKMPAGSDPHDVVSYLLLAAKAAGNAISAHLWLEDPATDTLRLVEACGDVLPQPIPVSTTAGILGTSLAERTAHLGPLLPDRSEVTDARRWRYAVPLTGSDIQGVAAIDFQGDDEPDREVLTAISAGLRASLSGGLALYVARLEAETARVLVDMCSKLSHVLDPDDVLRTALDHAMALDAAQTGSIMILDPQTHKMSIAVSRGLPEDVVATTCIPEGDGIAGWVLASKQPLVIEDLKETGIRSRRHGIRSAVCVPLADDQGVVGVLNVGCTSFHARISRSHLRTLEALGSTVVVALRSAWAAEGAQDLYFDTLKTLALALEARDPYSRGGVERIVDLTGAMSTYFGISEDDAKALRIAAMLHDLGMSAAGNVAPFTDEPLSTVEWGMLKMHPVIAAEIMSQAPALSSVIPLVYHHHEHFDGTGYVAGLAGTQIPLGARILSVADAYVAMTSGRPYRAALTRSQAVCEMRRLAGTQFDPRVVSALIEILQATDRAELLSN